MSTPIPTFDNVEERAGIRSFLHRQLYEKPTLPKNVNLEEQTAIITGSNSGIGLECARQLLDYGLSMLIIAVRNESNGQRARDILLSGRQEPLPSVEVWKLDLSSYNSVSAFAKRAQGLDRLDIVVLNAGISNQFYSKIESTGHEETIQVNILSTALLAILLLPIIKARKPDQPSRMVFVSSDMASWASLKQKDAIPLLAALDDPKNMDLGRYATSKLLGQLFVSELSKRVPPSLVIITMPNPGWTYGTGLGKDEGWTIGDTIISVPRRILGRSPSIASRLVTSGTVGFGAEAHGQYIEDGRIQPWIFAESHVLTSLIASKAPFAYTKDGERVARTLWDEIMAELSFAKVDRIFQELEQV